MITGNGLTNRYISENFTDKYFYLMPSDFIGAFSHWAAAQNQNEEIVLDKPVSAFRKYIKGCFDNIKIPQKFSYGQVSDIINEKIFIEIPEILALNEMKPDFIDLSALARNVFYTIIREQICQPL